MQHALGSKSIQGSSQSSFATCKRAENDHGSNSEYISESDDNMVTENVTLGNISGDDNSDEEKLDKNSSRIYHDINLYVKSLSSLDNWVLLKMWMKHHL